MPGRVNNNILKLAATLSDAVADKRCSEQLLNDVIRVFKRDYAVLYDDSISAIYNDKNLTLEQKYEQLSSKILSSSLRDEALIHYDFL